VKAADSSLLIAAFASWHEKHDVARRALDAGVRIVEHCALETYSVLTRLPPPHRAAGDVVAGFLRARATRPFLRLGPKAYREFVLSLPVHGIAGGAVYDALVAATVAEHGLALLSCDRRAAPTYEQYGLHFEIV
jgi:predicted nucleic acid-binding protein